MSREAEGGPPPEEQPLRWPTAGRSEAIATATEGQAPADECGVFCPETDAEHHAAIVAWRLTTLGAPNHEDRVSAQALLLSRLRYALDLFPGASHALEMRYIVWPADAATGTPERVESCLLARFADWRGDRATMQARARDFSREVGQLLGATLADYYFVPVRDPDEVAALLAPFPVAETLEIRQKPGPDGKLPEIFGGLPDADALVALMCRQPTATLLAVCVAPVEPEVALDQLTATAESDPEPLIGTTWAQPSEDRRASSLAPRLEAEYSLRRWQALRLAAFHRHIFRLRAQLASAGRLSEALVGMAVGEIGGPSRLLVHNAWQSPASLVAGSAAAVRPRNTHVRTDDAASETGLAQANLAQLGFAPWGVAPGAASPFLVDLGEAARVFPLPVKAAWLDAHSIALPLPYRERVADGLRLGVNRVLGAVWPVQMPYAARAHHTWIVGQTGTGKSTLLESLILQDIQAGRGVIAIDPHGELIEQILGKIPAARADDVIFFNPADTEFPIGLNLLEASTDDAKALVVSSFIGLLRKMFDPHTMGIVGPRFEHGARNAMLTVMSNPDGGTLVEVLRVLSDDNYMRTLLPHVTDPIVRRYWEDQIAHTADFHRSEVLDWVVSKFGPFVTDFTMRRIIGQVQSGFRFRPAMDEGKIVLLSLAKGKLGSTNANFLGLILLPMILQAALSRADLPPAARRECALYIDEFQNYASDSLALMLAEARKYQLALTLANQHVGQLTGEVRDAVLGNVGSTLAFRLGAADALAMEQILAPSPVAASHCLNLPNFTAYCRLLIGGRRTAAFTLETAPVTIPFDQARRDQIVAASRARYGRPRAEVDDEMNTRALLQPRPKPRPRMEFTLEGP